MNYTRRQDIKSKSIKSMHDIKEQFVYLVFLELTILLLVSLTVDLPTVEPSWVGVCSTLGVLWPPCPFLPPSISIKTPIKTRAIEAHCKVLME